MSSNSVLQKKDEIPEDGPSRIQQQMKFMFGELMTKIKKLETRYDEVLLETLQMKPRMILTVVVGSVHIGERGIRIGQRGDIFDDIGILSIEGILMIWEI